MVDDRVVANTLEQIEQYHGELAEKQSTLSRRELEGDVTEQRAVERMFENAIQSCADLALHIATSAFGYGGDSSKGAISVLQEEGVCSEETARTLLEAVGFRNMLAHEYGAIDYDIVYESLQQELWVYDEFTREVASWYQEHVED